MCGSDFIGCKQDHKKGKFVIRRINRFLWHGISKKGECSAMLWSFNLFSSRRLIVKRVRLCLNHLCRGVTRAQFTDRQLTWPLIFLISY